MSARTVIRTVSALLALVSLFMLSGVVVALAYGETELIDDFAYPAGAGILVGVLGVVALRQRQAFLSNRAGFVVVVLSWAVASFIGAMPAYLSGAIPSYTDAFFETMSGFTTTGASILNEIESLPRSILFWRSLTHWLGGMGIIVLTVAVLPLLGIGGLQLMKAEAPGPSVDKVTPKVTATAKILWLIYVFLSALQTILLVFGGMDLFDALTHTFGTLATGGFSPRNASIGAYSSPYIHVVITVFMVMAGVNFVMYHRLVTGRVGSILRDTELRVYLGIFVAASIVVTVALNSAGTYNTVSDSARHGAFQVATILTTTGYATADFAGWPALARGVLFLLMFVGGCAGSTGGGIKVVRIVTMVKHAFSELRTFLHPRAVFRIRINGAAVSQSVVNSVAGFVFLYVALLLTTTFVVSFDGVGLLTAFSTALVTLGNIGPGFGLVGPTENYAFYSDGVTWFLSFIMMAGRLEVYTVMVLFSRRFWLR